MNWQGKPILQRAWSDGAEHIVANRRVEDPRDRLQGFKEEDERYGMQNTEARGRRIENDRGDVRGRASDQGNDFDRPFITVGSAFESDRSEDHALNRRGDRQSAEQTADYVIAVIGQALVGKTTIIRKAFRSWGLVEPTISEDEDPRGNVQQYTANVETGQPPRMRVVQILEVDLRLVQVGNREARGSLHHKWPEGTPRVDGVMICYDAMSSSSVAGLAEAIRE